MKKRILHLIGNLRGGGAERQLVNVVSDTSPDEFTHLVCTLGEAGFYAPLILKKNYEIRELGITGKRPWMKAHRKFSEVVREYQPDLVNTWLYDANITARITKLRGIDKFPIVTSLQATEYEPETIRFGNWSAKKVEILRRIDKLTIRLTQPYFVACSGFVQNSFEKRLGILPEKTRMIYNSVNPESLTCADGDADEIRRELNIPTDAVIYLNIGRLDPQKNQLHLIESFARILPSAPNAYLIIVGDGRLKDDLNNSVKSLGIEKNVRLTGGRQDVGAFLSAADVFVFPSHFEGLPLALVEAMFKSLPCIASKIEVSEEVITDGENGLLINTNSSEKLKDAMLKLYNNEELRKSLGENAFREAHSKFNSVVTAKQWECFYREIISENN